MTCWGVPYQASICCSISSQQLNPELAKHVPITCDNRAGWYKDRQEDTWGRHDSCCMLPCFCGARTLYALVCLCRLAGRRAVIRGQVPCFDFVLNAYNVPGASLNGVGHECWRAA